MLALRLVMPAEGDMTLLAQGAGTIDLQPYFFGSEAMGPHLQIVDVETGKAGAPVKVNKVLGRYRLKIKPDGKVLLVRGKTAEEQPDSEET